MYLIKKLLTGAKLQTLWIHIKLLLLLLFTILRRITVCNFVLNNQRQDIMITIIVHCTLKILVRIIIGSGE